MAEENLAPSDSVNAKSLLNYLEEKDEKSMLIFRCFSYGGSCYE